MRGVLGLALGALALAGCTSLETVRLQPGTVEVGPGLRPIAAIQANASSFYLLFIPIPGAELDQVMSRMLAAAKAIGADKVVDVRFHVDPCEGFWCFWKVIGYREATATGIAVQVIGPPDPVAPAPP